MGAISLLALATALAAPAPPPPAPVVVASARARIVAGVRAGPTVPGQGITTNAAAKPRTRPCPEAGRTPCRLIVIDLP